MRYLIAIITIVILMLLSIGVYKSEVLPKEWQEDINLFVVEFNHVVIHGSITEPQKKLGDPQWWQSILEIDDVSDEVSTGSRF